MKWKIAILKNKIDNQKVKDKLKENIVGELNKNHFILGYVFNRTGLIITNNKSQLEENIWKSNLSFEEIIF